MKKKGVISTVTVLCILMLLITVSAVSYTHLVNVKAHIVIGNNRAKFFSDVSHSHRSDSVFQSCSSFLMSDGFLVNDLQNVLFMDIVYLM